MRILNVSKTIDPITGGGEAERTFQMSKFLVQSGADCRVLTVDTGLSAQRKSFLGEGNVIALTSLFRRFYVPVVSFRQIDALVHETDVIHLMGHWTVLNALVYRSIRKWNKPYVVCPAGALPIFGRSKIIKFLYNIIIGKRIIRNASMCIAVTTDEIDSFISYGVDRNRVLVIPNGVSEEDFIARDDKGFREKYGLGTLPFILFVGRLNLIKGPDLLLRAFCAIKDKFEAVNLVFVGPDDGILAQMKEIVTTEEIAARVHFLGYLGDSDKSHAYHAAKVLAIPSRQEAMSIVVLEAGVSSTPVLMTDQCGFDQIGAEGAGWVVPASIEGLSKGLDTILSDTEGIKIAAGRINKYVTSNFSWTVIVQDYWRLYKVLTDRSTNGNQVL